MKINPSIFREYDIRGIAGKDLSPEFAYHLGIAYAAFLKKSPIGKNKSSLQVSVGWDCRLTGESYSSALVKGIAESGINVVRLGVCPTPLTYFSLFHLDLDGAIMVTGSHNPSEYNGFKICLGKDTIHGHQIQELREIMESSRAPEGSHGEVTDYAIIPPYIDFHVKKALPLKKKKIVIDAGNAAASIVGPELFTRLGADVIPLYCEYDGRFPNHHPDPTVLHNLEKLIETVRETQADFGVAFDGDADRIGLVDETGRVIYGDEILIILSRDLLKDHPGAKIISEVKSSHRLYKDIADQGGQPLMWKTGHSLIKSKMKEIGALLAGEMSGHIFFADRYFGFDDAVYAALRVFEIACKTDKPLSSLIADLPKTFTTPEIRVDCIEEKKFLLVEETKKRLADGRKINDIDGVRVDFGSGWGLIRASNTQPVLVLRYESTSQSGLQEIRDIIESQLQASAKAIGHPEIEVPAS